VEDGVRCYDLGAGGARLILKQRQNVPLVSLALYCRGGSITEHDGVTGLTGIMARTSFPTPTPTSRVNSRPTCTPCNSVRATCGAAMHAKTIR
jgi:hypothetical protein